MSKKRAIVEKRIYVDRANNSNITVEIRVLRMLIYKKTATPDSVAMIGLKPL